MRYAIFVLFFCLSLGGRAQLANTSWKGTFTVPELIECDFIFKTDTAFLSAPALGGVIETMRYRVSGDTLFVSRISGMSPCYGDKEAVYLMKIENRKLFVTVVDDFCDIRAQAFPKDGLNMIEP